MSLYMCQGLLYMMCFGQAATARTTHRGTGAITQLTTATGRPTLYTATGTTYMCT